MSDLSFATPADIVTVSTSAGSGTSGLAARADHIHYFDGGSTGGGGSGYVPTTRQVIAGSGLTGGGALSSDVTLNVAAADTSITVAADSIGVNLAATSGLQISSGLLLADTVAGAGLTIASKVLAVGQGDGISVTADAVAVDTTVVRTTRTLTAGAGLTGGGDLSVDRTFAVGAGTLITVNADDVQVSAGANYQFVGTGAGTAPGWRNVSELAGAGLTAALGVLAVGAGTLVTVGADTVGITDGANYQFIGTGAGTSAGWRNVSELAGAGLTAATGILAVGAGAGLTVNADDVTLTTPGTLTVATGNSAAGNHTHAITSSSNPGAAASILASDASGHLQLVRLGIATAPSYPLHVVGTAGIDGDLTFVGAQSITTTADNLTIAPAGDVILDPTGNDILPNTGYDLNLGSIQKKYLTLHAAELWVETLVAQNTIATIGGRILVGPTTVLTRDITAGATTIYVKHNEMANADRAYFEANGWVEFISIDSAPTLEAAGDYSYTVTRNLDGSGANAWYAGDALFNLGTTGDGFIDIYSLRGVKSATQYGPSIVGNIRNSATFNDWTERWAIGELNGIYGYGVSTFGFAAGRYGASSTWIAAEATNGFRVMRGSTQLAQWDMSGNILVGQTGAGQSNVYITAGAVYLRNNATSLVTLDTGGSILVGQTGASQSNIYITSGKIALRNNTTAMIVLNADGTSSFESVMNIGTSGSIFQGTGTFASPTTAFKLYNSGGVGLWEMWGSGTKQVYASTDGKLYAGAGSTRLDSSGITILGRDTEYLGFSDSVADRVTVYYADSTPQFNIIYKKLTAPYNQYASILLTGTGVQINDLTIAVAGVLRLPSGGSINWNAGDVTITHSANTLTWAGATSGYIFNDGNVGIGTAGPVAKLDVVASNGDPAVWMRSDNAGRGYRLVTSDFVASSIGTHLGVDLGAGSGNTYARIQLKTTGNTVVGNLALQPDGGNVGIGTASPGAKLDVYGALESEIRISTAATNENIALKFYENTSNLGAYLQWRGSTDAGPYLQLATNVAAGQLQLSTGIGTEAMRIDSSGNVIIASNKQFIMTGTCSVRLGTNPATSGPLNFANNSNIYWRNAANNADIAGVKINASNELELGAPLKLDSGFYALGALATGKHVESGSATCAGGTVNVTFVDAFSLAPHVVLGGTSQNYYAQTSASTTGFTLTSDNATGTAHWLAFGAG